jgi:hypothetical protein
MRFLLVIEIVEMFIFSSQNQRHLSFTEFVKWILSFCPNVETLKLNFHEKPEGLTNYIARLKKLNDLDIATGRETDQKEVTCVAFRTKTTLLTSS